MIEGISKKDLPFFMACIHDIFHNATIEQKQDIAALVQEYCTELDPRRNEMTEWKEYTGSDEQIRELLLTSDKFIVDSKSSIFREPTTLRLQPLTANIEWLRNLLNGSNVKRFLICNPHPHADMARQQLFTGQPVWYRYTDMYEMVISRVTNEPNWNIPNAEYSFTPFEEVK